MGILKYMWWFLIARDTEGFWAIAQLLYRIIVFGVIFGIGYFIFQLITI